MVEPRKPKELRKLAKATAGGGLTESQLAEYDALLSARFSHDPSVKPTTEQKKARAARERRIKSLGQKLSKALR